MVWKRPGTDRGRATRWSRRRVLAGSVATTGLATGLFGARANEWSPARAASREVSGERDSIDFHSRDLIVATFFTASTVSEPDGSGRPIDRRIGLYASNDGQVFKYLGETGVSGRDSSLLYKDGVFYLLTTATAGDYPNYAINVYKSVDLVTWTTTEDCRYEFSDVAERRDGGAFNWGPKWVEDGDDTYIIVAFESDKDRITHGLLPFSPYPIMNTYIIPVEGWGTKQEQQSVETRNLAFAEPKKVNWGHKRGLSFRYWEGEVEQVSRIGSYVSVNRQNKRRYGYRYILFTKYDPWGDIEIWGSDQLYGTDAWHPIDLYLRYDTSADEDPDETIDREHMQIRRLFEGNYPIQIGDLTYLYTDNYAYSATNYLRDGGMYYTTSWDFRQGFTKPVPITVINTEERPADIRDYITRNGTVKRLPDPHARKLLERFSNNKVFYSTTRPTRKTVAVTIRSNDRLQPVDGWNLDDSRTRLTKTFVKNTTLTVVLKGEQGDVLEQVEIEIANIRK